MKLKRDQYITVVVNTDLHNKLKMYIEKQELKPSIVEVVRVALEDFLKKRSENL